MLFQKLISWDFHTTIYKVYREWYKKYSGNGSSLSDNALLMKKVRGECPEWLKLIGHLE